MSKKKITKKVTKKVIAAPVLGVSLPSKIGDITWVDDILALRLLAENGLLSGTKVETVQTEYVDAAGSIKRNNRPGRQYEAGRVEGYQLS